VGEGIGVKPLGPVEANMGSPGQGPRPYSREGARGDDRHTNDWSIIVRLLLLLSLSVSQNVLVAHWFQIRT